MSQVEIRAILRLAYVHNFKEVLLILYRLDKGV